jgi:hypothetical protein
MKKKILTLKDKFFEELIKAAFMFSIYFYYNRGIYTQKDFFTKLRDSLAILIPYVIYIILLSLSSLKTKPIIVNIKMRNSTLKDKEETIIYHHNTSREDARKVNLTVSLSNKSTAWATIASWIFKKSKFVVQISFQPPADELLCQTCSHADDVTDNGSSFLIDISKLVTSKLDYNAPCIINEPFVVSENVDMLPVRSRSYYIYPILLINGKRLNFLQKRFINISIDLKEGYYLIEYVK